MAGVVAVREGNFVGVAAPTAQEAEQALAKIKAQWSPTSSQSSSKSLYADLKRAGGDIQSDAALEEALKKAAQSVQISSSAFAANTAATQPPFASSTQWASTMCLALLRASPSHVWPQHKQPSPRRRHKVSLIIDFDKASQHGRLFCGTTRISISGFVTPELLDNLSSELHFCLLCVE